MNLEEKSEQFRQRSSRRLRHEAQAKVFRDQKGSLEEIRLSLGLRPSQFCELLKVHPSAWIRWTKTGKVPPHVYQMVEWYLELLQWRGQNHPLSMENGLPSKAVATSDPASFVSPELQRKPKVEGRTQKILILVWCIQTVLWCIVLAVLLKR
jgi:DNA-binding transcriptional regulator YiaG